MNGIGVILLSTAVTIAAEERRRGAVIGDWR